MSILVMKKLEIKKTNPAFIKSVLKVEYQVVLVSSITNVFTNKIYLANELMSFSSINSALVSRLCLKVEPQCEK